MSDDQAPVILSDLIELHPADLADLLQRLPPKEARAMLPELPPALAASALSECAT